MCDRSIGLPQYHCKFRVTFETYLSCSIYGNKGKHFAHDFVYGNIHTEGEILACTEF